MEKRLDKLACWYAEVTDNDNGPDELRAMLSRRFPAQFARVSQAFRRKEFRDLYFVHMLVHGLLRDGRLPAAVYDRAEPLLRDEPADHDALVARLRAGLDHEFNHDVAMSRFSNNAVYRQALAMLPRVN